MTLQEILALARISTILTQLVLSFLILVRENVYLSEILDNSDFKKKDIKLPIALGKSISGTPLIEIYQPCLTC